jgi:hypothetical protein
MDTKRLTRRGRFAWAARTAVAAAALLAAQAASAETLLTFYGAGFMVPSGLALPNGDQPVETLGSVQVVGGGEWSLVFAGAFNFGTGLGSGTFSFAQGSSSLSGTVAAAVQPVALGSGWEMTYTATGGTGDLAGYVGGGSSLVRLTSDLRTTPPWNYIEVGIFSISPIPEPTSALLMLGGIGLLLGRRLRR